METYCSISSRDRITPCFQNMAQLKSNLKGKKFTLVLKLNITWENIHDKDITAHVAPQCRSQMRQKQCLKDYLYQQSKAYGWISALSDDTLHYNTRYLQNSKFCMISFTWSSTKDINQINGRLGPGERGTRKLLRVMEISVSWGGGDHICQNSNSTL